MTSIAITAKQIVNITVRAGDCPLHKLLDKPMKSNEIGKLFKRWTLSVDMVSFFSLLCIISFGIWVSIASTPAVAMNLRLSPFYFVKHHIVIAQASILIIVLISCMQIKYIRKLSVVGYFICLAMLACTLLFGEEIKGSRRWLSILRVSIQPSEFLKPALSVVTAWLVSEQYRDRRFPGILLAIVCVSIAIPFLLLQPDVGMTVIIVSSWIAQLFISGLSITMIILFLFVSAGSIFWLYAMSPHVSDRIDKFIMKNGHEDVYQVKKSIEAFMSGGLFGKGPGEGIVKTMVPDAHSDFVFSVIAEEFGFITCSLIILMFVIFIVRSMVRSLNSSNMFNLSAAFGILFQIGMQVLINVSTSLDLIPTKGMTMPFVSYGGCSMFASAISVGIVLAITKRKHTSAVLPIEASPSRTD